MRAAIKFIGLYIGLSVFLGLTWAVFSYPDLPSTGTQWLMVFLLALPLQLAGEFLGELLWNNKLSRFVDRKTAAASLSFVRILYGVLLMLLLIGLGWGASYGWEVFWSPELK
jgi:hypothetical protein